MLSFPRWTAEFHYLIIFLVCFLYILPYHIGMAHIHHERLYDHLFRNKNYIKETPPLMSSGPIVVNISLDLASIIDLNERSQELSGSWLLTLVWSDERLMWSPFDFGDVQEIIVPGSTVWLPDIGVFNGQSSHNSIYSLMDDRFRVKLLWIGYVSWFTAGGSKTSCHLNTRYFPFDEQLCSLHLESISACAEELLLAPRADNIGIGLKTYQQNEQWEVVDTWQKEDLRMCASNLKFYLHVRRKPQFFLMNIVLPIMILSAMTLTVFWLPSDSGEKISLAVTIVLAFTVFQLVVSNILPRSSDATPLLAIFVFCATLMSSVSLVTSVALMHLVNMTHHHHPPPFFMSFIRCLAGMLCMSFSVCTATDSEESEKADYNINFDFDERHLSLYSTMTIQTQNDNDAGMIHALEKMCNDVSRDLKILTRSSVKKLSTQKAREEWIVAANVIDRLLFWFFVLSNAILVAFLFGYRKEITREDSTV